MPRLSSQSFDLYCPTGSAATVGELVGQEGSTSCSPCDPGTYATIEEGQSYHTCVPCPDGYYRSGDASIGNNACRPIPAGVILPAVCSDLLVATNTCCGRSAMCCSRQTICTNHSLRLQGGEPHNHHIRPGTDSSVQVNKLPSVGATRAPTLSAAAEKPAVAQPDCLPCPPPSSSARERFLTGWAQLAIPPTHKRASLAWVTTSMRHALVSAVSCC